MIQRSKSKPNDTKPINALELYSTSASTKSFMSMSELAISQMIKLKQKHRPPYNHRFLISGFTEK